MSNSSHKTFVISCLTFFSVMLLPVALQAEDRVTDVTAEDSTTTPRDDGVDNDCDGTVDECPVAEPATVSSADDCDDGDACRRPDETVAGDGEEEQVRPANPTTTIETDNTCDGVTCSDGSCAATVDECAVSVVPSTVESMNTLDSDDDGDGLGDATSITPVTSDALDGETTDDIGRAQNHNSLRSNRTTGVALDDSELDEGGEQDGLIEVVALQEIGFVVAANSDSDEGGEMYCWGEGGSVSGSSVCLTTRPAADGETGTSSVSVTSIMVDGDWVRSWGNNEQAAWQVDSQSDTLPELSLMAEMVKQIQADERIVKIVTSSDDPEETVSLTYQPIIVRYQVEMQLFGFIPLEREVEASISGDGTIAADYPWYRFLTRVPQAGQLEQLLSTLHTKIVG